MFKRSLVLVVVLLALVVMPASAQGPVIGGRLAVVGVDDVAVTVGQEFAVPVWINGVSNLYGADVKLVYDATVLQGVSVERGTLLSPDFVVRQGFYGPPFCSTACARYALTQINPTPPVTGSGTFMIVHFRALRQGTVNLTLSAELSDRHGVLLPHVYRPGTVSIK